MKSLRQYYIDIIMKDDEDNELQLEFLQTLTLKDLEKMSSRISIPDDDV